MSDARVRTITWEDPTILVERGRGLDGLEMLRAIVRGELPPPPMAQLLGFRFVEADPGRVVFEVEPHESAYNTVGAIHGGFALTIADSAIGCAVHSKLPVGVRAVGTDVQYRFLRPMLSDMGTVRCEGIALHVGRTTGVAEARITDARGRLLGIGSGACAILRREG